MLQTLFYIPAEVAGIPVFGLGLLLAVWAVASVAVLARLVRRQGFNADTWGYVPILLLVGAIIRWLLPVIAEEGKGLPIHGYGVMMLLAVLAATGLSASRARRAGFDSEMIFSLIFWMLVPGIIGARAFYVIEYWPEYWRTYVEPGGGLGPFVAAVLSVNKGGLVLYGAFFGGVTGLLLFVRKHRLPLLALCDLIAPSMMLGLAIGRIGCLLNGCCYGGLCHHDWAVSFPPGSPPYRSQVERGQMYGFALDANPAAEPVVRAVEPDSPAGRAGLMPGDRLQSINGFEVAVTGHAYYALEQAFNGGKPLRIEIEQRRGPQYTSLQAMRRGFTVPAMAPPPRSLSVHPTQVYSTIDGLLLCLLLLAYAPLRRRDGEVFALLMSIYPITRFLIEGLRNDEAAIYGTGLSISQNVSIVLLLCAAALWFYILRQPRLGARDAGQGIASPFIEREESNVQ